MNKALVAVKQVGMFLISAPRLLFGHGLRASGPTVVGDHSHSTQLSNHETLTIMFSNAQSLLPKIEELRVLVYSNQPDIICIVESWHI